MIQGHGYTGFARILSILVAALIFAFSVDRSDAQSRAGVLILDQGGPGLIAYAEIATHLRSVLNVEAERPVDVYAESLDLGRFDGSAYRKAYEDLLRSKYAAIKIDIIVALGVRALDYAISYREQFSPETAIVFAVVPNGQLAGRKLPTNITGETLDVTFSNALVAARAVVPGLRAMALVGDPLNRQTFRFHFVKEIGTIRSQVEIIDLTGLAMDEVKRRVSNLPADTCVVYTAINVDGEGRTFLPRDALEEVVNAANRPVVTDIESHLSRGAIGGFVVLTSVVGRQIGHLTSRILRGESADAIAVADAGATKPVFNWRELRRWGVDESRLPEGSEIRFRQLPIWKQYPYRVAGIVIAVLVQAALIVGLVFEERRRRRAETENQILLAEVLHLNRYATAGELTASIAHEVRQPLAAIVASGSAGLTWLQGKTPNIEEVRLALTDIVASSHRANDVIQAMLTMFRKHKGPHAKVNLNIALDQVLVLCSQKLQATSISLRKQLLAYPDPIVLGNSVQLQQLFLNLVMNAIEAMNHADAARVLSVRTGLIDNDFFVEIRDSGSGIPVSLKTDDIFKPFVTGKEGGVGLGLAICKSIVEMHRGRITVRKDAVSGMVFLVTIPRATQT